MSIKIIGNNLPNIPFQERTENNGLPLWRYNENPIIGRNAIPCASRIFNSAVVPFGGQFAGVFRADTKRVNPQLHRGFSEDGIHWQIDEAPIEWLDANGNPIHDGDFAYDPRVIPIDGLYYIVWCCDFASCPALGLGVTSDFKTFTRLENVTIPFNRNGVLFPRKIDGVYKILTRPSDSGHTPFGDIFISDSPDLTYWGRHRLVMKSGGNQWEGTKIGAGPAPIETDKGWLLLYHGVTTTCNGYVYSMGAALLDRDKPEKVLARCRAYVMTPEADYETVGFVPNVTFPCATLCDAATGRIAVYYGAADTCTALAFTTIDELYDYMMKNNREVNG